MNQVETDKVMPLGSCWQRKTQLIDLKLQLPLIIAVVALEVVILGGATFYLYLQFEQIFSDSAIATDVPQPSLLSMFLKELGTVMLTMSITNTVLLLLIHKLWLLRIQRVLQQMSVRLRRIEMLDLSPLADVVDERSHPVLGLLDTWRLAECQRQEQLQQTLSGLPESFSRFAEADKQKLLSQLRRCQKILS